LDFVLTKIYPRRQIKHDKKSFYAYVRSKTKFKATVGPLSNSSGQLYTQNVDMAEEFNKYFASVYTKEDTTIFLKQVAYTKALSTTLFKMC